MSERNSQRYHVFNCLLTSILSMMQSPVFWQWSLWMSHHRFGFRKESSAFIFWGHLTWGPIYLKTLTNSGFEMDMWEIFCHVHIVIPSALSKGRFWYMPWFLLLPLFQASDRFFILVVFVAPCSFWHLLWEILERLATSSSHFTCVHARDSTSSMILHWYFASSMYRSPPGSIPLLKAEIIVVSFHPRMATFSCLKLYVAA